MFALSDAPIIHFRKYHIWNEKSFWFNLHNKGLQENNVLFLLMNTSEKHKATRVSC